MTEKILVIAAHPDDEVLGCGGTISKHSRSGDEVYILIISEGSTSRQLNRDRSLVINELDDLSIAAKKSASILGAKSIKLLDLPDNRLDTIPLLDLIKVIEKNIEIIKPSIIYTHHIGDLNIDHSRIHQAVLTACRPIPKQGVKRLLSFEISSSTEWQSSSSSQQFNPNLFVDITEDLDVKKKALTSYDCEMRDWPHARSIKGVEYLAKLRGCQIGVEAAESFMIIRSLE